MAKTRSEKSIEAAFVKYVKERGAIAVKLNMLGRFGRSGLPDRMVLLGVGLAYFVEFKKLGALPTRKQLHVHQALKAQGYRVSVHDTLEAAQLEFSQALEVASYATSHRGVEIYGLAPRGGYSKVSLPRPRKITQKNLRQHSKSRGRLSRVARSD